MRFLSLTALVVAFALGCASAPWENMSQTDIESWTGLGYSSAQAQELVEHGIDPATAATWKQAGIMGWESIDAWQKNGMSPSVAGGWHSAGFTALDAGSWAEEKFEASEAKEWRRLGKSLSAATDARAQGLMPIPAVSSESEESSDTPAGDSSDAETTDGSDAETDDGSAAENAESSE